MDGMTINHIVSIDHGSYPLPITLSPRLNRLGCKVSKFFLAPHRWLHSFHGDLGVRDELMDF